MRAKRQVRTWLQLLSGITMGALTLPTASTPSDAHGMRMASTAATEASVAASAPVARASSGPPSPSSRNGPAPPASSEPPGGDTSVPAVARLWPVGIRPTVLRGWQPPPTPYGPGHRGVDLAAEPGSPVRSVAPGRVSFAGRVAGRGTVAVELTGTGSPPLRTTFTPVRATVKKGDEVTAGEVLGTLETDGSHCPASCLHWGLLRDRTYLDPLSLLPAWLLHPAPSRLLPVPTGDGGLGPRVR
ncbi:murein hydrolase activator EnvC family protein [Streptomyces sp. NPDC056785]|uniref:murein hydrolase activator EnvC family protein n=1 Tax=Streptomyces sp. NPDC056785 TaxID=3345944 RepID=UPI0036B47AE9